MNKKPYHLGIFLSIVGRQCLLLLEIYFWVLIDKGLQWIVGTYLGSDGYQVDLNQYERSPSPTLRTNRDFLKKIPP